MLAKDVVLTPPARLKDARNPQRWRISRHPNFRLGSLVLPAFYPSRNHIKMEITFLGMSWYTTVEITFKYKFHFPIQRNLLHMSSSTNSSRLARVFLPVESNFSSCCHHTSFQQVGKNEEVDKLLSPFVFYAEGSVTFCSYSHRSPFDYSNAVRNFTASRKCDRKQQLHELISSCAFYNRPTFSARKKFH